MSDNQDFSSLIDTLECRFKKNMHRHEELQWQEIRSKLDANREKLLILHNMEETGGEPDVVGLDEETSTYLFYDCSTESPKGRRSICYDRAAQHGRKKYPPKSNAEVMAAELGVELLNEKEYRYLQQLNPVDTQTSSWIKTPAEIRDLGGALFGDYRYGAVFIYHNGADSYYGARGFRGCLKL
ncbi:DUF4256 domain-containing protein [uncultured Marivirga sp.]|uniref:DUF4256 domain-containing protein n=1 Tax=uncultured Marivirga sp. TaxID=1123707 RepID=UPI0030EDF1BB|tara:strand:- start:25966 stop:26514 length:549 start_codon:yes stop_codon:yes gene_type:complete